MKECPISIIGIYHCSQMDSNNCLIAANEGVRNGDLSNLKNEYNKIPRETLQMTLEVFRSRKNCAAHTENIHAIESILNSSD